MHVPPPLPLPPIGIAVECRLLVAANKLAQAAEQGSDDDQPKALEDMSIDEFMAGGFLAQPADGDASDDSGEFVQRRDASQTPSCHHVSAAELRQLPPLLLDDESSEISVLSGTSDDEEAPLPATSPPSKQQASVGHKRKQADKQLPTAVEEEHSSEDESEEGSEQPDVEGEGEGEGKSTLKTEMAAHKAQLEALKQQDPEFYAYLQVRNSWLRHHACTVTVPMRQLIVNCLPRYSPQTRSCSTLAKTRMRIWTARRRERGATAIPWHLMTSNMLESLAPRPQESSSSVAASHCTWWKAGARQEETRPVWELCGIS